jgi:hypothetical protein
MPATVDVLVRLMDSFDAARPMFVVELAFAPDCPRQSLFRDREIPLQKIFAKVYELERCVAASSRGPEQRS